MTRMDGLRRAWLEVGRADFLSTPVLVAYVALTIPFALYVDVVATDGSLGSWIAASAGSILAVAGILVILGNIVHRRWPDGPGPWRAVAVYAGAGALRGLLMWATTEALGLVSSIDLLSRVLQSAVWSLGVLSCASVLATRRSEHRRLMDALAQRERELLALQSTLGDRILQTHHELVQQVQRELSPTLEHLRSELNHLAQSADAGAEAAVEDFRTAVAEVVRPLSRTLAEPSEPHVLVSPDTLSLPAPRTEPIPAATVIAPTASVALALVLTMLTFAIAPGDFRTAAEAVRLAVLLIGLWFVLQGLRWIARRAAWRARPPTLLGSMGALFIVAAVLVGSITRAVTSGLPLPTTRFPAVALSIIILAPWAVSAATALQSSARAAERRRTETVAELERLTAVLRRELWQERRRLALTVHGPIQSALVAASVTMSRPGFSPEQIPVLAMTLDQAMAHIDRSAGPPPPIAAGARDLAALWVESAGITFISTDEAAAAIDADDALRAVVIEVMREGVSNAVRHGSADHIDVSLLCRDTGTVTVSIEDDGDGAPTRCEKGLGSAMFNEVGLYWHLERAGAMTRLEVVLATDTG